MIARFSALAVCMLAIAATPAAQQKTDQDKIQGTWKFESGIHGGKTMPDEMVKTSTIAFKGDKMTVVAGESKKEIKFKMDPTKTPKAMDVEIDGKAGLGIYSLEGDTLRICHGEAGDPRPTEFASKEGSKNTLVVLKRVK